MTKEELRKKLHLEGIRDNAYNFDGVLVDEAYVLEEQRDQWTVFYSERGIRSGATSFASESAACAYLYERLHRDPTASR